MRWATLERLQGELRSLRGRHSFKFPVPTVCCWSPRDRVAQLRSVSAHLRFALLTFRHYSNAFPGPLSRTRLGLYFLKSVHYIDGLHPRWLFLKCQPPNELLFTL